MTNTTGPLIYQNWKIALTQAVAEMTYEYPLFTDAHIIDELTTGYGPYQIINTCPDPTRRHFRPTLVLRADFYLTYDDINRSMDKTDDERYHGGYFQDEIAALISLCLGIRLQAGGANRIFEGNKDHRGRPVAWDFNEDPVLPQVPHRPIVPNALGTHDLKQASPLAKLYTLEPQDATALVRAARLYQDGLWIAESQPALSWIMFVSAVETIANRWQAAIEAPLDRLRASKPDLEALLLKQGDENFAREVAEHIAPYMGSTKKFVDFILTFLPDPPEIRPPEIFQHPWTVKEMKKSMKQIYDYRSRALHGGTPFPAPMWMPPFSHGTNAFDEKMIGTAMGTRANVWLTKDIPMYLHTFEYIVRNSLLKWWNSLY